MIPDAQIDRRRLVFFRNRGGFLLGVTWVHYQQLVAPPDPLLPRLVGHDPAD